MLPRPFINYIPLFYKRDAKLIAFATKVDSIMDDMESDILGLNNLIDTPKIPANLLDEVGYYLAAGINPGDDETLKRKKIRSAIAAHKVRTTWQFDAKIKIDNYVGGDSSFYQIIGVDEWILVGDGNTPSAYYWAAMGADGVDLDLGIALMGSGEEFGIAGNIFIDVDSSTLTTTEVEELKNELTDVAPAYMRIYLGYISAGMFITYANGVIG